MISKISGLIDDLKPTEVTVSVGGVGYGLAIPLSTYEKIVGLSEVTLYVHTFHREDQLRLYGFFTEDERTVFSQLISISGIGPAVAIAVLSGVSIGRLIEAVQTDNPALLTSIPGIGKAKAEKLVFELKRRLKKIRLHERTEEAAPARSDALEALVTLGFDETKSARAIDAIMAEHPDYTLEALIKESLKRLSG